MPAKSQRGIRRPRISGGPDLELRKSVLKLLQEIREKKSLRWLADRLDVSEKTLSRYMSDRIDPPATLGGDALFKLCEAGYSITCRGRTLRCVAAKASRPRPTSEQLRFEYAAEIDLMLPSRKLVARAGRITRRKAAI